jgi:hypothetical protein
MPWVRTQVADGRPARRGLGEQPPRTQFLEAEETSFPPPQLDGRDSTPANLTNRDNDAASLGTRPDVHVLSLDVRGTRFASSCPASDNRLLSLRRRRTQRTTPQNPRLENPSRGLPRTTVKPTHRCDDRLNPPCAE